ncbi:hypothetical protein RJT34_23113 [Clitoria ternatea]|uniref:Uncharacterized protein n=1 Tax=Clitoria ternatea TaxID=43366 RepID=A0AAN9FU11_CLITE
MISLLLVTDPVWMSAPKVVTSARLFQRGNRYPGVVSTYRQSELVQDNTMTPDKAPVTRQKIMGIATGTRTKMPFSTLRAIICS